MYNHPVESHSKVDDELLLWSAAAKGMSVSVTVTEGKAIIWSHPDYKYVVHKSHCTGDVKLEWWPKHD